MMNIHTATIRLFLQGEYMYLAPFIKLSGETLPIPHRTIGSFQIVNGWKRYKLLRKLIDCSTHVRHFELIDRLAELKEGLTSRNLLTHPEASSLLLELITLNRLTDRETLLEFAIKGELARVSRSMRLF